MRASGAGAAIHWRAFAVTSPMAAKSNPAPARNVSVLPPAEMAQQMAEMDDTPMAPVVKEDRDRVGRNDPCWCGSGKKFKRSHGA